MYSINIGDADFLKDNYFYKVKIIGGMQYTDNANQLTTMYFLTSHGQKYATSSFKYNAFGYKSIDIVKIDNFSKYIDKIKNTHDEKNIRYYKITDKESPIAQGIDKIKSEEVKQFIIKKPNFILFESDFGDVKINGIQQDLSGFVPRNETEEITEEQFKELINYVKTIEEPKKDNDKNER